MSRKLVCLAVGCLLLGSGSPLRSDVTVPTLFSDFAVLQRGVPVPVWGTADPWEEISVDFGGRSQSTTADKELDDMIIKAQTASGEERIKLWQAVFKRVNEDIICDVPLFHMVGYTRVGKRINFKPSIATNSELQLSQITFK